MDWDADFRELVWVCSIEAKQKTWGLKNFCHKN